MDRQLMTLQQELDGFAQRANAEAGIEFWFARDLQPPPRLYAFGELSNDHSEGYNLL